MKTLDLGWSGIRVSQLVFGTGSLHHLTGPAEREALLQAALDVGITHFDTAPYYGFGLAETTLAAVARRPGVTLTTKVGLYPPGGADQGRVQILARKVAGKLVSSFSKPIADLGVARARESLAGSRRRLGRERIDLLLAHEPDHALYASDEWLRFLESEGGGIGAFGVAGEAAQVLPFIAARDANVKIVQTRDSLARQEAQPLRATGRPPNLTFGHLAAMTPGKTAAETLAAAVAAHPDEAIVVSTRRADRLPALAAAIG